MQHAEEEPCGRNPTKWDFLKPNETLSSSACCRNITSVSGVQDSEWSTVDTGGTHTCAINTDGQLYCWGWNFYGQIGDGTTTNKHSPTRIGVDSDWTSVSSGSNHTCAIKEGGELYCWGVNGNGRLGDGSVTQRNTPTRIGTDADWSIITAGWEFSCGIKTSGQLYCWGLDRLVDDTPKLNPTRVGTESEWANVTGSMHGCALKNDGSVYCWGYNNYGQVGDGTTTLRRAPFLVTR